MKPDRARTGLIGLVLLTCVVAGACADGKTPSIELAVWAKPGAETDPRVIRVYEHHACSGTVAVIRGQALPAISDERLEPELVIEFDADAETLDAWPMPVDLIVLGISGDEIIVPHRGARGDGALAISTAGNVSLTQAPPGRASGTPVPCPGITAFGESAYLRCFEFTDLETGARRRLAYQGPCT